jgi:Papain-like cysteine protease AvrRpt2
VKKGGLALLFCFVISCGCAYAQTVFPFDGYTARINSTMVVAVAPELQKTSVWCWAASLSLIFTYEGHPISQEQIIIQNFDSLENAPAGDFLNFEDKLNGEYIDANGKKFTSDAIQIFSIADATHSLILGYPILFKGIHHAFVQTAITKKNTSESGYTGMVGTFWDPEPGVGYFRNFDIYRYINYTGLGIYNSAWSITTQ